MSSSEIEGQLKARNEEIGQLLRRAREAASRSQAECAAHLGMSRQRYNRLENGHQTIGVAEYEALRDYLDAGRRSMSTPPQDGADHRHVSVEARPGQTVHVSIHVTEGESTRSSGGSAGVIDSEASF